MLAAPLLFLLLNHFRVITSTGVCVCVCGENPKEKAEKRECHGGAKPKWRRRRHHHYRHHRRQDIVKLNLLSTHSMCI